MIKQDRISAKELAFIILASTTEIGMLVYPRSLVETAGSGAALAGLLVVPVILAMVILNTRLALRFPGQTMIEFAPAVVGWPLGKLIGLMAILFWILLTARVTRQFADVIKIHLLDRTPVEVVVLILLLAAMYLAYLGLEPLARVSVILTFFMYLPLTMLIFLSLRNVMWDNLLPVLGPGLPALGKAVLFGAMYYEGFEIPLMLVPFVADRANAVRTGVMGIAVVGLFAAFTAISVLAVFGPVETKYLLFPTMSVIQTIGLPNVFLERLGALFMSFWIVAAFTTVTTNFYLAAGALQQWLGLGSHRLLLLLILPIIFVLSLLPANIAQVFTWAQWLSILFVAIGVVIPIILLVTAILRGLGKSSI